MASIEGLKKRIRYTEKKIAECEAALKEIEPVETKVQRKRNDWRSSYQVLRNDKELMEVRRAEFFEGEMADKLNEKMAETDKAIVSGIEGADDLATALSQQEEYLREKISELKAELARLKAELAREEAKERERRRKRAKEG